MRKGSSWCESVWPGHSLLELGKSVSIGGIRLLQRSKEFEEQVLAHMDMLHAVALRLTRNSADAEDLTQNTLVKALRFHDRFKEGTFIKAWLLTILRNTFINEYRKRSRTPLSVELTGAEAAEPTAFPAGEQERLRNMMELLDDEVRQAVEELPDDFRNAVIMADLEERSYKEIAEFMGCPIGTVMSRLYRGRKILREKLSNYAHSVGVSGKVVDR